MASAAAKGESMKNNQKKIWLGLAVILLGIIILLALDSSGLKTSTSPADVTQISRAEAEEKVRSLAEVKNYINNLAKAGVVAQINAEDSGEEWNVQVFEIVKQGDSSHTATFGWYTVNKKTGEIKAEFE